MSDPDKRTVDERRRDGQEDIRRQIEETRRRAWEQSSQTERIEPSKQELPKKSS